MARHRPTAPAAATNLGHIPEWDPPASATATRRWSCLCGHVVMQSASGFVYGTATTERCPDEEQRNLERELAEVRDAVS